MFKKILSWIIGAPLAFILYLAFWIGFYYDLNFLVLAMMFLLTFSILYFSRRNLPFIKSFGIGVLFVLVSILLIDGGAFF